LNSISFRGFQFSYDAEGDPYGEAMWSGLLNGVYESTTLGFLISSLKANRVFVDVGAASGLFTLLAGALGSKVIAIEAHPQWYSLLVRNLSLNDFGSQVTALNVAVTSTRLAKLEPNNLDSKILSVSVMDSKTFNDSRPRVDSLAGILRGNLTDSGPIIVKMDIEGAEFEILKDKESCSVLREYRALLFLSLHPGFPYNKKTSNFVSWLLNATYSRFRGLLDSHRIFIQLDGRRTCRLPNGRRITRKSDFLALTFFGAHDFIFDLSA